MPSELVGRLLTRASLWSHKYNSKTKVSSDSPKYEHQRIWGKAILGHTNIASNSVSIPRWPKPEGQLQPGRISVLQIEIHFHGFLP